MRLATRPERARRGNRLDASSLALSSTLARFAHLGSTSFRRLASLPPHHQCPPPPSQPPRAASLSSSPPAARPSRQHRSRRGPSSRQTTTRAGARSAAAAPSARGALPREGLTRRRSPGLLPARRRPRAPRAGGRRLAGLPAGSLTSAGSSTTVSCLSRSLSDLLAACLLSEEGRPSLGALERTVGQLAGTSLALFPRVDGTLEAGARERGAEKACCSSLPLARLHL